MSDIQVYMVIDDYAPDAGSRIYGIYADRGDAEEYVKTGIKEDYGDDVDTSSIDIRTESVIAKK